MDKTIANSTPKISRKTVAIFVAGTIMAAGSVITLMRTIDRDLTANENNPAIIAIEKEKRPYQDKIDHIQQREDVIIESTMPKHYIRTDVEVGAVAVVGIILMGMGVLRRMSEIIATPKDGAPSAAE